MKKIFGALRGQGLIKNMLALWGVQLYRKTIPLVTMPYLARILGPAGWGKVAFVQAFAAFLILFIEFGFEISGTREIARCADSPSKRADIFVGVLGAQVLLVLLATVIVLLVRGWIPIFRDHPELVWIGLLLAAAEAINPTWYFLGIERMGTVATLEIVCKSIAAAGIFILIKSPSQIRVVLLLQALAPLLSTLISLTLVLPHLPLRMPTFSLIRRTLAMGWHGFLFRSSESLYTIGNVFVLGLLASPVQVGYFAGSEKISRAFFGLLEPIRQTMYARLSSLMHKSRDEAVHLAKVGTVLTGTAALIMGVLVFFCAPLLIRTFLGKDFQPAVAVLRVLAALPVLMGIRQCLGFQWLLPMGKERTVNKIFLRAGVLNLTLALMLGSAFAHMGMAYAVITAESFVCISMIWAVFSITHESLEFATAVQSMRTKVANVAARVFVSIE